MSEIDVSRDIMDITFSLNSDVNVSDIKYTLDIVKWTEDELSVFANFSNPLLISQGQSRDQMGVVIKSSKWFKAKLTGEEIDLSLPENQ